MDVTEQLIKVDIMVKVNEIPNENNLQLHNYNRDCCVYRIIELITELELI